MTLHRTSKTFTDRSACNVNVLTREVMVRDDFLTNVQHRVRIDAELSNLALGFHFRSCEMATHGLACAFGFRRTGTQLNGGIAVTVCGALCDNLKLVQLKNGHRNLLAVFHEQPGHADFFCNNA